MTEYENGLDMKHTWHNQACANCGVTAELHGSCGMDGKGPMTPTVECHRFEWSLVNYAAATPVWIKLEHRISKLEEKVWHA